MWGVCIGDVDPEYVNILESPQVNELMERADVALVNNKVFGEMREFPPSVIRLPLGTKHWYCTVNEAIRPKFLCLKEGALVILLEPFVAGGWRAATERNVNDISAILDCPRKTTTQWTSHGGPARSTCIVWTAPGTQACALASKQRGGARRGTDDDLHYFSFLL